MAIYTFYPCRDDGSATTFEALDLCGDQDTAQVAASVLSRHGSAAYVSVWESDRNVALLRRDPAGSEGS